MLPARSDVNFTPTSTELSGPASTTPGTALLSHRLATDGGDVFVDKGTV